MAQTLDLGRVVGGQGPKGDPFMYSDFTAEQLAALRGPKGNTGNGIERVQMGEDDTLTLHFTDGDSYTTPPIRGRKGEDGVMMRCMFELAFPASDWTEQEDGSFVQTAGAEGMLETDVAHVDLDMSAVTPQSYADVSGAWALVAGAKTQDGGMMMICYDGAPDVDLAVKAEVIR